MSFQFVDNTVAIDATARRSIRRHAAKGRNLGRKIVRPSRRRAFGPELKVVVAAHRTPGTSAPDWSDDRLADQLEFLEIERQLGDGLSALCIPATLAEETRPLIQKATSFFHHLRYTPQLQHAFDDSKGPPSLWMQLMFVDEACFHATMAAALLSLSNLTADKPPSSVALHHLARTFRLVEKTLSSDDAANDKSIATIVLLAQYERHMERYDQCLVHMQGLLRMVDMRGGIASIMRQNPLVGHKVVRLDLELAIYQGGPTRFSLEEIRCSTDAISWLHERFEAECGPMKVLRDNFSKASSEMQSLSADTMAIAWLLNEASAKRRPKLNMRIFHEVLLVTAYRLVRFRPLGQPRPANSWDDAAQLGLLCFLVPFMHRLDGRIPDTPLLRDLTRSSTERGLGDDDGSKKVLLWILFMAGSSIFASRTEGWLLKNISQITKQLRLGSWQQVLGVLANFPWIHELTGRAGESLYYQSTSQETVVSENGR